MKTENKKQVWGSPSAACSLRTSRNINPTKWQSLERNYQSSGKAVYMIDKDVKSRLSLWWLGSGDLVKYYHKYQVVRCYIFCSWYPDWSLVLGVSHINLSGAIIIIQLFTNSQTVKQSTAQHSYYNTPTLLLSTLTTLKQLQHSLSTRNTTTTPDWLAPLVCLSVFSF